MFTWVIGLLLLSSTVIALEDNSPSIGDNLIGVWVLNIKLSDDPDDQLKGKLRKRYNPLNPYKRKHPGSNRSAPQAAMDHYWETLRASEERKASKNLRRLGPAFLLFTFEKIEISRTGNEQIALSYDSSPGRKIAPNKNGRIFSAKGAELTTSYFGHTLSYHQENQLILETDAPDGGKFIEKLSTSNGKLEYEILIDSLVLKETVTVKRSFSKQ